MNCMKAQQWISMALDGELPESKRTRLQKHMEACPSCRELEARWTGYRGLLKANAAARPAQTPEAAWADVQRAIRLQAPSGQPALPFIFGWRLQAAGVILAAVVIGIGGFLMNRAAAPRQAGTVESSGAPLARTAVTSVEAVEARLPGATTMVYEDAASGMMVIWMLANDGKENGHAGS